MTSDALLLTGLENNNLVNYKNHKLEPRTLEAFLDLQQRILNLTNGEVQLEIISSYRDFNRQLKIWNEKADGVRKILDRDNNEFDINKASEQEIIDAILVFSALPGASRHHWGSDFDIYDAKAISKEDLKLINIEYEQAGPCERLSTLLNQEMEEFGFFRPYQKENRLGVSKELWHLSYAPVSTTLLNEFKVEYLIEALNTSDIKFRDQILVHIDSIFEKYVKNID